MDWPTDVLPGALQQPDSVSCGPTSVVAARMLLEPSWRPPDVPAEIARTHQRLTSTHSARDRFQMPWPRRLGTPPWAVANAFTSLIGAERIAAVNVRPRPEVGFDVLVEQVRRRPVAVYLGNRWLPRHVVLAFEEVHHEDAVRLFDPARGELVTVPRDRWTQHRVGVAGWSYFWFVV
ncbi:hypothetical protein F0U44_02235 [Nocardioides humilatus]|uniref:Peptidase C39 domain-containing protein n=1 Tax=Nocardioides humilatus TaxID=2607660 RepID=A0A5B1LKS2_9ACTN|nr:hypothetical protein [Nocardioides humilatus]KAA1421153.1 hypothetical protein F0U44_02235 [Nocardioides humilatus]